MICILILFDWNGFDRPAAKHVELDVISTYTLSRSANVELVYVVPPVPTPCGVPVANGTKYHWYVAPDPPPVDVAVNVVGMPAQFGLWFTDILMVGLMDPTMSNTYGIAVPGPELHPFDVVTTKFTCLPLSFVETGA